MLEVLFDRALIEIAQRAATARGPIEEIADQVKAPPRAMASPPVFDETRCVRHVVRGSHSLGVETVGSAASILP
jgi:hypothetical protein